MSRPSRTYIQVTMSLRTVAHQILQDAARDSHQGKRCRRHGSVEVNRRRCAFGPGQSVRQRRGSQTSHQRPHPESAEQHLAEDQATANCLRQFLLSDSSSASVAVSCCLVEGPRAGVHHHAARQRLDRKPIRLIYGREPACSGQTPRTPVTVGRPITTAAEPVVCPPLTMNSRVVPL